MSFVYAGKKSPGFQAFIIQQPINFLGRVTEVPFVRCPLRSCPYISSTVTGIREDPSHLLASVFVARWLSNSTSMPERT